MPLPDERPRQSVANLIGRFEQQTKRQSIGPTTAPLLQRAVSVSSQNTGDSAKEEAKEKKEWPPRTLKDESSSTPSPPAPVRQWSLKPTVSPAAAPKNDPIASSVSNPEAISVRAPPDVAMTSAGKSPTSPSTSPKTRTSTKLSSSKSAPLPRAPSTPAKKPTTKPLSPPSSLKSPPPAKPLRAQHTGQSTTSNTSTARVRTQSTRSASATPSHPKAPSAATTGAARPKTPSSTPRPKTPSSGLYAPTAASLAKARDAAPPLPTPSRRTSMVSPSAVIDRLSKPTAASASKARTPVVTATPPLARATSTKSSARGGAPAKGAVKPRVGLAPARMKEEKERKEKAIEAVKGVAAASAAVGGSVAAVSASQHTNGETVGNGVDEHIEDLSGTVSHDGTAEEGSVETSTPQSHETEDGNGEADAEIESYDEDFVDETLNHDEIHHGLVDAGLAARASSEPHPEDDAAELHMSVPATHAVVAEPEELEHEAHTEDAENTHDAPAEKELLINPEHEATYSAEAEADLEEGETTPQQEESRQAVPDASADLHHSADIVTPQPGAAEGTNEVDEPSTKAASGGDDIEDIVKMLESSSVVRRSPSIASIPDEESEE